MGTIKVLVSLGITLEMATPDAPMETGDPTTPLIVMRAVGADPPDKNRLRVFVEVDAVQVPIRVPTILYPPTATPNDKKFAGVMVVVVKVNGPPENEAAPSNMIEWPVTYPGIELIETGRVCHVAVVELVAVKTWLADGAVAAETSTSVVADLRSLAVRTFVVPVAVLFVRVSVVARPTSVSVAVGKVIVPVFVIAENTGAVEKVFAPANV